METPPQRPANDSDLPTQVQRVKSRGVPPPALTPAGAETLRGISVGAEVGPYKIIGVIGAGGMGVVYRAYQASLQRDVALKVLSPDLVNQEGFIERFEREALSLARLHHPGIVAVMDKGVHDGQYYFVMEFVDGVSLRAMLHERPLEMRPALLILKQVCEALEYAHSQGFVHRDIKPENILIDTRGAVKVADFGLAVLARPAAGDRRMTGGPAVIGTPDYMAPEQRRDSSKVDARADVYALGVVLYEALTGRLPLGRFAPPSLCAAVDSRLDRVVLRMLEPEPEGRFASAAEVGRALETISASGITVLERTEGEDGTKAFEGKRYRTMSRFLRLMMPMLAILMLAWAGVSGWLAWDEWHTHTNPRWTYIGCTVLFAVLSHFFIRLSRTFFVEFTPEFLVLRPHMQIPWKSIDRFYTQERHPSFLASHMAILVRYRIRGIQVIRTVIGNPAFLENSEDIVRGLIAYAAHHRIPVDEDLLAWGWRSDAEEPAPPEARSRPLLSRIPTLTGVCRRTAQYLSFDPYVLRILLLLVVIVCGVVPALRWTVGASLVFLYVAAALILPESEDRR